MNILKLISWMICFVFVAPLIALMFPIMIARDVWAGNENMGEWPWPWDLVIGLFKDARSPSKVKYTP